MEKESLEVINAPEKQIHLEYELPNFGKRVFANFLDIIFLFLGVISVYIGVHATTKATPQYWKNDNYIAQVRSESGLFRYASSRETWENISTWLDNNNDTSYDSRNYVCTLAINDFIEYIHTNCSEDQYDEIVSDYENCRLSDNLLDKEGKHLFAWVDVPVQQTDENGNPVFDENNKPVYVVDEHGDVVTIKEIRKNPDSKANSQYYYENFYREYTLVNCGGFLLKFFPRYLVATQTLSDLFFFIEIPITLFFGCAIVYYLPGIIFRRGHPTFGKKIMGMGDVDSKILSPKFGRFTAKYAIFFFGEIILSLFTFGIPLIISFSMMAFSKKKQGFPNYMLGLTEIDTNKQKIYFTKYEISLEFAKDHKKAINFTPVTKE